MCGRFTLTQSRYELEGFFKVEPDHDHIAEGQLEPIWNLPPTTDIPGAQVGRDGEMQLDLYRWGFIPNWVTDISQFKLTNINARAKSVARAKTYAAAFRRHRLLVPADRFFEWDRTDPKNKQPYAFVRRDGEPMAFAGLFDSYLHPCRGRRGSSSS